MKSEVKNIGMIVFPSLLKHISNQNTTQKKHFDLNKNVD